MKEKAATVPMAGPERGMMIFHRMVRREAPSIIAASSSSKGNVRKNCLKRRGI
jgi:hypothetical protein